MVMDYAEALSWFRKAADKGSRYAEVMIGEMYIRGYGVPQDYAKAASWFEKAANQGDLNGQEELATMYENGWGVSQNYV